MKPVPPPPPKRHRLRWIVLAVLAAVSIAAFWGYREATAVPEFYAQVLARAPAARPPQIAADDLEREVLGVQNQLQRAEPWRLVLKEDDINAWLMTELAEKMPRALPKEITDPRIVIQGDTVFFACKHQQALGGVLSIALEPSLTDRPNEIAVRVRSFSLGRLPLPQRQYLDEISRAAAQAKLPLAWDDEEGTAVARITVPEEYDDLPDRKVRVESLQLREGELEIRGTAERR